MRCRKRFTADYDWLCYQNRFPGWTVQDSPQAMRQAALDDALYALSDCSS